jgi:hypothetical protein
MLADGALVGDGRAVGFAALPGGKSVWVAYQSGAVVAYGGAPVLGSASIGARDVVGIAATLDGHGYWLVTSTGQVLSFGNARRYTGPPPTSAVVGIASSPGGRGFWLLDEAGNVYPYGQARFYGEASNAAGPFRQIVATPNHQGYWLLSATGSVYGFGNAEAHKKPKGDLRGQIFVALGSTSNGRGYWEVSATGRIWSFGDASKPPRKGATDVVSIVAASKGRGYTELGWDGQFYQFQNGPIFAVTAALPQAAAGAGASASSVPGLPAVTTTTAAPLTTVPTTTTSVGLPTTTTTLTPTTTQAGQPASPSLYDDTLLSQNPVMYLTMGHSSSGSEPDLSGDGQNGTYYPTGEEPEAVVLPNGDLAADFNGTSEYLQVPNDVDLSVTDTGELTVEAWVRPDTLQFPAEQGTGYVNFMGKGDDGNEEYELRMYSLVNTEVPVRPNRVCAYAFNLDGGEGSGAYFQDPVTVGQWMMVTMVINTSPLSPTYPTGYIKIYNDAQLRGTVPLTQFDVTPQHGNAPFRVGTSSLESNFEGAIGKVAVFDYELSPAQIGQAYAAMTG